MECPKPGPTTWRVEPQGGRQHALQTVTARQHFRDITHPVTAPGRPGDPVRCKQPATEMVSTGSRWCDGRNMPGFAKRLRARGRGALTELTRLSPPPENQDAGTAWGIWVLPHRQMGMISVHYEPLMGREGCEVRVRNSIFALEV